MSESIGVLALQGCIDPHLNMLQRLGYSALRVTSMEGLKKVDRLILPGGESSTMIRFLTQLPTTARTSKNAPRKPNEFFLALQAFCRTNPVWGICAGSILLSKEVENPTQLSLAAIDIKAIRNFYGSQKESFKATIPIKPLGKSLSVDFIRAPKLVPITIDSPEQSLTQPPASSVVMEPEIAATAGQVAAESSPIITIAEIDGVGVGYQQNKVMVTAFHTELGNDPALHEYFIRVL